ncbi:NAD-dependent epimerase/dehydratase family protein [Micromonosporaceae bacterium B7E4]
MRVFITGGAGFVGSHLTETVLAAGHDVVVIDDFSTGRKQNLAAVSGHDRLTVHEIDLAAAEAADLVRDFRPDVMLLLGAQISVKVSMRDPLLDARVNILGLVNLMNAAVESGTKRVAFASSGGTIYGPVPAEMLPITEETRRLPASFYGLTKGASQEYLRLYQEHYGIDWVALALGNVYGPRQDPLGEVGVISMFAHRMLRGERCVINGDGMTTRDYVYVTDVVKAFLAAMHRGTGLVNVGTGRETSVLDVLHTLARHIGVPAAYWHGPPLPGEVRRVALSPVRAHEQLGWQASVPLDAGIAAIVAHFREDSTNALFG